MSPQLHSCLSSCYLQNIDFDDILATVSFLMEKNVQAKFWTTYQERRYLTAINPIFDYEIMWELNCQIWEKTYKIGSGEELAVMVPAFLTSSLKHCLYISI